MVIFITHFYHLLISTSQTLTGGDVLFLLQRERQESNLRDVF